MAFTSKLPRVFARTGYKDDFYWSVSGSRSSASTSPPACAGGDGGWNCHQFHANSEFYADFGSYAVEITAR